MDVRRFLRSVVIVALAVVTPSVIAQPGKRSADQPGAGSLRSLRVVGGDPEFLGEVDPMEHVTRRLEFQNVLDVPVSLRITGTTCGCLQGRFEPALVEAGKRTVLTMAIVAAPAQGPQTHAVSFTASWEKNGLPQEEKAQCGVGYQSRVDITVFPEVIALTGVVGERLAVDVVLRTGDEEIGRPEIVEAHCSLPGWKVQPAGNEELATDAARYTITGPVAEVGFLDGKIEWVTRSKSTPRLTVPIRLRGVTPWRAFPGGVTFVDAPPGGAVSRTLRLIPRRDDVHGPAAVEIVPAAPVSARLEALVDGAVSLTIELRRHDTSQKFGHARVVVKDAWGAPLCEVPVVWCPKASEFPGAAAKSMGR